MKCLLIGAIAPQLGNQVSPGCLPFGAMALSGFLKKQGVPCQVVSTALPGALDEIFQELPKINLLGISSMSGPYLSYAISIAENIKKLRPDLPIVWGGAHASLMGEDLIQRGLADFVIKGVGERALLALIKSLEEKTSLSFVPGLVWKENGRIKQNNPDSEYDINGFPQLDYSLIEAKYSFLLTDEFSYFSSRGCPYNCSYCVSSILYNRRWYNKSEDKVVDELRQSYQRFKFKSVMFWDDNLFVDVRRLSNIFLRLRKYGIHFQWSGFCRADLFSRLSDKFIGELKESGIKWLSVGAESGSQMVLERLNKGIKVDHIKESVTKLRKGHILCDFSFMGGMPGETAEDFRLTLDLVNWIKDNCPQASVRIFRFIPYPCMPILKDIDVLLPANTYEWSKVTYQNTKLFKIPREIERALRILSPASLYPYKPEGFSLRNLFIAILFYISQLRLKTRFFYFPIEGTMVERIYAKLSSKILNNFNKNFREKSAKFNYILP